MQLRSLLLSMLMLCAIAVTAQQQGDDENGGAPSSWSDPFAPEPENPGDQPATPGTWTDPFQSDDATGENPGEIESPNGWTDPFQSDDTTPGDDGGQVQPPTGWTDPFQSDDAAPGDDGGQVQSPTGWTDPFPSIEGIGGDDDDNAITPPSGWKDPYPTIPPTIITIDDQGLPGVCSMLANEEERVSVEVHRRLLGGMYNTLCLPFEVSDIENTPLAGSLILEFNAAEVVRQSDGSVILDVNFEYTNTIYAGYPYLIQPPMDINEPMLFKSVVFSELNGLTRTSEFVDFVAVMEPYNIPIKENYLMMGVGNNLFYSNGDGTLMNGLRAFFHIKEAYIAQTQPRARMSIGRKIATNIDENQANEMGAEKYLMNGTVYIRRNGEIYTMQGIRVK